MADDLSDVYAELRQLKDDLRRLKNTQMLQNASVTEGRLRFIGGLLLIDSGGTLTVIGTMNGTGDFNWTGPWTLSGAGDITGDVEISGDVDLTGEMTVAGSQPIRLTTEAGQAVMVAGAGRVRGTSDGINVQSGTASLFAAGGVIQGAGATYGGYQIAATSGGVQVLGIPSVPAAEVDAMLGVKNGYIVKVV